MRLYQQLKKNTFKLFFILILINFLFGSWPLLVKKNITFHTDIARDFSLLEDIIKSRRPTLIGPRAGGISGVFHGPLWLYLNLPPFILGDGNPVIVGYFWIVLAIFAVFLLFISSKKIFNKKTAFFASALYSSVVTRHIPSLFNSFGALIFTPLFFLFFYEYVKTKKTRFLYLCLFFLGVLVQFQVGYGGVLLLLTFIYFSFKFLKERNYFNFSSFFVLVIPLSTFILFELRHNFFQIRSVISYFYHKQIAGEPLFFDWLFSRLRGIFFDGINLMPHGYYWNFPITLLLIMLFFKVLVDKRLKNRQAYLHFYYLYLGFWLMIFFYKGIVWGFFYWGFLPLVIMIFSSLHKIFDKKIFLTLYLIVYLSNLFYGFLIAKNFTDQWQLYYEMAKKIYHDATEKEFGYFVFSPDLYGYSGRYALSYTQKEYPNKKGIAYEKRRETYLLIEPPPDDRPWLKGEWWIKNQVKINKKPIKVFSFGKYRIEKYTLNENEIKIPADSNLIKDTHFR